MYDIISAYLLVGLFIGTFVVFVEYMLHRPFVELDIVGLIIAIVWWPLATFDLIMRLIRGN